MKMTKVIYLASPYSPVEKGLTEKQGDHIRHHRYNHITKIASVLNEKYSYAFILPITMSHATSLHSVDRLHSGFSHWARRDFAYISKCDELWVALMPGWMKSIGVREEIKFALKRKIKVRYLDVRHYKLYEIGDIQ